MLSEIHISPAENEANETSQVGAPFMEKFSIEACKRFFEILVK